MKRLHPSSRGFTLLELVVAVLIALFILGFALALVVQQRQQFVLDQARTQVNQTLRAGMDLVGIDVRQAGENVNDTVLPVVSVANNTAPNPGQVLTLQRKLTAVQLRLCLPPAGANLVVSIQGAPAGSIPSSCIASFNSVGDPLPVDVQNWQNFRCNGDENNRTACARTTTLANPTDCKQKGGTDTACVWAYIHDPSNNRGEFFLADLEGSQVGSIAGTPTTNYYLHRVDGTTWTNPTGYVAINPNNPPSVYILEEREYRLIPDTNTTRTDDFALQLTLNRQNDNQQRIVNQIANFQVDVQLPPGTAALPFNVVNTDPTYLTSWKPIEYVKVTLTAVNYPNAPSNKPLDTASQVKVPASQLTLVSQFLPRNALSNPVTATP